MQHVIFQHEREEDRRESEEASETDHLLAQQTVDRNREYLLFLTEHLNTPVKRKIFVLDILEHYDLKVKPDLPGQYPLLYFIKESSNEVIRVIPSVPALLRDLLERYADFDLDELLTTALTNGREDCRVIIQENIDRNTRRNNPVSEVALIREKPDHVQTGCEAANYMWLFGRPRRRNDSRDIEEEKKASCLPWPFG